MGAHGGHIRHYSLTFRTRIKGGDKHFINCLDFVFNIDEVSFFQWHDYNTPDKLQN